MNQKLLWMVTCMFLVGMGCSGDEESDSAAGDTQNVIAAPDAESDTGDAPAPEQDTTVEDVQAQPDDDCDLLTNEGCNVDQVCCDFEGNVTCVPSGTCKTVSGTCEDDTDCDP